MYSAQYVIWGVKAKFAFKLLRYFSACFTSENMKMSLFISQKNMHEKEKFFFLIYETA